MKKIATTAVLLLTGIYTSFGQTSLDTIPVNYTGYYYTNWYSDDPCFVNDGWVDTCYRLFYWPSLHHARAILWQYTTQPLKVKGLAVMTGVNPYPSRFHNPDRVAEYLYLYQLDTTTPECGYSYRVPMIKLDSVRFDTATPKVMLLPRYLNDTVPNTCNIYEGYFKSPVVVDSSFYIFQSMNNNHQTSGIFDHIPFWYVEMKRSFNYRCPGGRLYEDELCPPTYCHDLGRIFWGETEEDNYFYTEVGSDIVGYFFPIVDQYNIDVRSADSLTGSVSGGGLIPDGWVDTLRAFPSAGYEFTHWSDGNTDNPRLITVSCDSTFIATFERTDRTYTLSLGVNNREWGSVEGAGTYPVYQQVEIRAVPADERFAFVGWNDGNWENPRTITLNSDTSFTANFQQVQGIEEDGTQANGTQAALLAEIRPNPATGSVRIDVKVSGRCRAEFIDAAGRLRYARNFDGPAADIDISLLQPGAWIVRITTPAGTTYRRLVVK